MNIKYQDSIISWIDNLTLDTIPRPILFEGKRGSGKHLICNYLVDRFNLEYIDITDKLNLDTIEEIYTLSQFRFYLIDTDKISIKEQNVILKFLEEPPVFALILLTNSNGLLLDTIINRCYKVRLEKYTKYQLESFVESKVNELVLDISETPGELLSMLNSNFDSMLDFANKIFNHIKTANLSNCLTICNKLYFDKVEDDKFFVDDFCKILLYISKNISFDIYRLTNQLYNDLIIPHINKKSLFEKYLIELKYSL